MIVCPKLLSRNVICVIKYEVEIPEGRYCAWQFNCCTMHSDRIWRSEFDRVLGPINYARWEPIEGSSLHFEEDHQSIARSSGASYPAPANTSANTVHVDPTRIRTNDYWTRVPRHTGATDSAHFNPLPAAVISPDSPQGQLIWKSTIKYV